LRRVLNLARQVAPSTATVLISGASGTGKELFARYIHRHSRRSAKPFVAVNCAALPEHLLESELFGHEKGAFTGAVQRKPGKFELASSGTLFLDEISEMDLSLQAKLLRAIQEGEIDRVGGTESITVDVRIICTTNRDIQSFVEQGRFRQDLYYRLNVIPLKLPALQDRPEDIPVLAEHFIETFCRQYGVPKLELTPQAKTWLQEHDWPGNVRELQNLMERAVLLAGQGPIEKAHFLLDSDNPDWEGLEAAESAGQEPSTPVGSEGGLPEAPLSTLAEMEKRLIKQSLENTSGNRTQAAKLLGISVRTLRNKLNEYRKQGEVI
jgi:DNA-binding NtrC family response regulator